MKHKKESQISCHFQHDYEQQHTTWLGQSISKQNVPASGEMDLIAITAAIDAVRGHRRADHGCHANT